MKPYTPFHITVFTMSGAAVLEFDMDQPRREGVDVSSIQPGLYLIQVTQPGGKKDQITFIKK